MTQSVVFITGVAGGIGQAVAGIFAEHGWRVAGVDLSPNPPPQVDWYYAADLADADTIQMLSAEFSKHLGQVHALIHNAAFQVCQSAQQTALADWDRVMAVNVRAPFWLTQQLYPALCAARGNVVHIASVHALATSANIAAYAASKGALVALTRAQAIDFAGDGIRVNAVLPGAVDTPMLEAGLTRGHLGVTDNLANLKKMLAAKIVTGKIAMPRDIAEAVYFLADNQRAGLMTGQTLVVDGGALARLSTE